MTPQPGSLPVMPERREPPPRADWAAWIILLCGMVVALAVFSHEPAGASPKLLGRPGDWLACELALALGSAVHAFLAVWFIAVLTLLVRKSWLRWLGRLLGSLLLMPC